MKCRICKSNHLVEVLSLGKQYLSEFRNDNIKPAQYPLNLIICEDCNQVQLDNTVPQDVLYTDNYGYRSGINTTMKNHLATLVSELRFMTDLDTSDIVVDIGSNDGTLLKNYPYWCRKVGYDLVPKFGHDYYSTQIEFYNEAFTRENFKGKAKIITAISMFYDLDNPIALVNDMAACLDRNGVIVIQQNYLLDMLTNNAFDNICHEHLCYHSVLSMERVLLNTDLMIFDVKLTNLNGGSFRTYICHKGSYKQSARVTKQRNIEIDYELDNVQAYYSFANRVDKIANELHKLLEEIAHEGSCYLYGASTRGNTLLQYCRLDNKLVQKAVERNPEKYGKKIASVGIPIISEEQARIEKPSYMLVLPWFFKEEFLDREAQYLKDGGKLIFPLPKVEVISK